MEIAIRLQHDRLPSVQALREDLFVNIGLHCWEVRYDDTSPAPESFV